VLVVGLGNPGARYADTRHNAGFMVVDALAQAMGVRVAKVFLRPYALGARGRQYLVTPLTYMNRSGAAFADLLRRTRCGLADLLVVYDNVDLPPGTCRLKLRGAGGGGHHGVESIHAALGTGDFMRLSVGIGRPDGGSDLAEYVLAPPSQEEAAAFREGVERAARAVLALMEKSAAEVMNELNRRNGAPQP
jgi:peptidyl-tRNA hydrolase, PTH1 family